MIARPFSIFILLCLLPMVAFSQNPPAGTRINSSRDADAITVVNLQQLDEIREIERLLAARKTAEAYAWPPEFKENLGGYSTLKISALYLPTNQARTARAKSALPHLHHDGQ
ncbi:MAG: hypothetical protein ISP88_11250 [Pseudomonadales bacterium]|nr:hypothetical protein [Pseudomonadales bacterium]MBL6816492.1 hypothetical protein [Pseudomonadales bacterium]